MVGIEVFRNFILSTAPVNCGATVEEVNTKLNTENCSKTIAQPNLFCRRTELSMYTEYKNSNKENVANRYDGNPNSIERGIRFIRYSVINFIDFLRQMKFENVLKPKVETRNESNEVMQNDFFPEDSESTFATSLWAVFNL